MVVYHGEQTPEGDPIEPEEQPAEVVQPIKAVVTIGHGAMREDVPLHTLPQHVQDLARGKGAHVAHQTSAGELAQSVLQRCQYCVHFDPVGWGTLLREVQARGDKAQLAELNIVRAQLAESLELDVAMIERHDLDKSGDTDLEHALKSLGRCKALTEHFKDEVIVYPLNPCAMPDFFKAKPSVRKLAASGYDWIMRSAQGRRG